MNKKHFVACLTLILCFLLAPMANGQEPGSEPQLPGSPFSQMMSGLNPANWTLPKMPSMKSLMPSSKEKERVITKKDSLVDEVSGTAKKSWERTKTTLNPMNYIPAGFKQNSQTKPVEKKEGGFFSGLFAPFPKAEKDSSSQSVNDFLKQEKL